MVNVTYGILTSNPDGTYTFDKMGTDIVSTLNGETTGKSHSPRVARPPPPPPPHF